MYTWAGYPQVRLTGEFDAANRPGLAFPREALRPCGARRPRRARRPLLPARARGGRAAEPWHAAAAPRPHPRGSVAALPLELGGRRPVDLVAGHRRTGPARAAAGARPVR